MNLKAGTLGARLPRTTRFILDGKRPPSRTEQAILGKGSAGISFEWVIQLEMRPGRQDSWITSLENELTEQQREDTVHRVGETMNLAFFTTALNLCA